MSMTFHKKRYPIISSSTPVSSTNKTHRYDIDTTEIMLKVALHAITLTNTFVYIKCKVHNKTC